MRDRSEDVAPFIHTFFHSYPLIQSKASYVFGKTPGELYPGQYIHKVPGAKVAVVPFLVPWRDDNQRRTVVHDDNNFLTTAVCHEGSSSVSGNQACQPEELDTEAG